MKRMAKTIIVKPDSKSGKQILQTVLAVAAFCVLFLTLISPLKLNAAYYAALPLGAAVASVALLFYDKKYAKLIIAAALLVVTGALIAIFKPMQNGFLSYLNGAAETINRTRHAGYASYVATESFGASFLFASLIAIWLAVFAVFAVKLSYLYLCVSAPLLLSLLFVGLYPQIYAIILLVLVNVGILALHSGFSWKALGCYLACTVVVALAVLPCYFFKGSNGVSGFRDQISAAFEKAIYGKSLPNGRLEDSKGMRQSDEVRLELTLSRLTPTLYLRGFVGGELNGTKWAETDRNAYVENGYQGLLDYIAEGDLPTMQYAKYSQLQRGNNHYTVTLKNLSADRRYVYVPYTLSEYSVGKEYYDLGLRGGAFTDRSYTYTVFASDESSERVTQAQWVMEDANRTPEIEAYIKLEGQYRAFIYDTYLRMDSAAQAMLSSAVGDFKTTSVNTATQFIRAYFLEKYGYADKCDDVKSDFITEFFSGKVKRGNAAYFASAATYMFRSLGFAARYVEGYTVHADASGSNATIGATVTGQDTHAWTEVYFDGIGWLPIEVTPTFFTEQPPDVVIDPNDPEIGSTLPSEPEAGQPSLPDEDAQAPETPDVPPVVDPNPPVQKPVLMSVLEVLVPIGAVIGGILAIALGVALRRLLKRSKRRKQLEASGAAFGRAAYAIAKRDCKYFGGFDAARLEKLGVSERGTKRFIRIAEQCVYGEYEVSETERKFVLWYLETAQAALLNSCGFFRKLYYKYVVCIVI